MTDLELLSVMARNFNPWMEWRIYRLGYSV